MSQPDLSVTICGVRFANPTVLASGILGLSEDLLIRVGEAGAGAVVTKSCGLKPRAGYPNPVVADWGAGLINAVGLSNPGVDATIEELRVAKRVLKPKGIAVIASIFAESVWDFGTVAQKISAAEPDLIEVNISCPNVENEFGQFFCATPYVAAQVTRRVKQTTQIPIIVKLSPNEANIAEIAKAVVDAGADAVSAINTLGPGMVLDIESRAPVISNRVGGISGPAIHPIAVRCVNDIARVVKVPIIGIGGNATARDGIEMIIAGAHAVGIGSAIYTRGLSVFGEVTRGMQEYMRRHDFTRLDDFRGDLLATAPVIGIAPNRAPTLVNG
ncbi:MAG: dihydroorotate dehydrogenase [Chloroflexi bacterium]|nr:dihydroorotate dehydrogenase [Chloroflexota bacterium]